MTQRISDVPDILRSIFELLDKCDLARLMRVSRCFFDCAAPLLWSQMQISDATQLLRTLPIDSWEGVTDQASVDNLKPLKEEHLERFHFYAPYITTLAQSFRRGALELTWGTLIKLVPTRPLLPNLRELILNFHWDYLRADATDLRATVQVLPTIEAFLSPSLVEIRTLDSGNQELFHPLLTSQLVTIITKMCPDIQLLGIYSTYGALRGRFVPISRPSVSISPLLLNLSNLRVLGISHEVLFPNAFVLLGSLPELESLSIFSPDSPDQAIDLSGTVVPEASFPALKYLAVSFPRQLLRLLPQLWRIPPLVRHLVSVCIRFGRGWEVDCEAKLRDIISSIFLGSPEITNLHLDLDDLRESAECFYSPLVLSQLKGLPLQRLRVLHDTYRLPTGQPCDWQQFGQAFPHLGYLQMHVPLVTIQDLAMIARHLPMLCFLKIVPNLGDWSSSIQIPPPRTVTTFLPSLRLILANFSDGGWPSSSDCAETVSTVLHRLWPNGVHCECWCNEMDTWGNEHGGYYSGLEALINDAIKQLCAPKEVNPLSTDEIAKGWMHANPHHVCWLANMFMDY